LEPLGQEALAIPNLLADDRSGVYEILVDVHQQTGDSVGVKTLAWQWLTFLEGVAAHADSPQQRSTFDAHRVEAAIAAGDPSRAIPALEASERDQPEDYNPPARLALVYGELGKLDEALAASDRALAKVYGPRTLRLLQQRASLLEKKGDKGAARGVLQHALELTPKLLTGTAQDKTRQALEKRLADLKA
jgi:tetratricopeptide (TPR) repeat protein